MLEKLLLFHLTEKRNLRICEKCRKSVRLTPDEDKSRCPRCKNDSFTKWIEGEDSSIDTWLEQRIFYWRNRIEDLEKRLDEGKLDDLGLFTFRTEEHTAQISEKLNLDDVFSATEIHELDPRYSNKKGIKLL